ncbi:mastermind-like protein 2 [Dipodomys merriami]|uniref:mastermind-like protein 2 n=1 Tax=Dipodomys merriami TaxID=94247 RepID=UPI003855B85B
MGDTAPPQAPAGGLGGVPGAGLLGGGPVTPVTPRVHSAIVERLRARIAVCRQHHLSCEGRYERGRAESSDRERESTLQLLSLVQHGQGPRRAGKHARAAPAAPPAPPGPAPPRAGPSPASDHLRRQQHPLNSGNTGINGDQQQRPASTSGDQRNSALIALQGSLKRKQAISLSPVSKRPNGFVDNSFLDRKRICAGESLPAGQSSLHVSNGPSQLLVGAVPGSQAPLRKASTLPPPAHSPGSSLFNTGLKEVKKEPGEALSCSKHMDGQMVQESVFPDRFGDEPGEQLMDPELQELFNELSNISVPPMSDLDLENMINATIKQDDPFHLDLSQQSQRSTPRPSLPMEKIVIKSEFSPVLTQGPSSSPQLRPPSAGPAFSMASSALSTSSPTPAAPQGQAQAQAQTAPGVSRALPGWQEVSHAQQLKQIAASRQQQARTQQHPPAPWPALPSSAGPSPAAFGQEKIPSPAFGQQPFNPRGSPIPGVGGSSNQPKVMASYMYKAGPAAPGAALDALLQQKPPELSRSFLNSSHQALEPRPGNTKPLFHFGSDQANQQLPSVLPSQSKPSLLHYTQQQPQQNSLVNQQQPPPPPAPQASHPLSSQPLLRSPLPLPQKSLLQKMQNPSLPGLGCQVAQPHRQDQHSVVGQNTGPSPTPNACSNPNTGSGYMNSQQSLLNQQLMGKKQTLQKQIAEQKQQLLLQQQMLADAEKITPQEQINRHLTRLPPDYKDQRRSVGSLLPAAQFSGGSSSVSLNSNQALTNPVSTHAILNQNPSLMSASHATRASSLPTAAHSTGVCTGLPCGQPGTYGASPGMNQLTQQRNPNQLLAHPSNPLLPQPSTLGPNSSSDVATRALGFGAGTAGNSQLRPNLTHTMAGLPGQRPSSSSSSSSSSASSSASASASSGVATPHRATRTWASPGVTASQQVSLGVAGGRFPAAYAPGQSLQTPQRTAAPPGQLTPTVQMRPASQMGQTLSGQTVDPPRGLSLRPGQLGTQVLSNLTPTGAGLNLPRTGMSQRPPLTPSTFPSSDQSSSAFQGSEQVSELAFDLLGRQADSVGPALDSDVDFIDSLLRTEAGHDDWMKDISLDEILGSNS